MRLRGSQFLRMQRYGKRMRNSFQKTDKLVRFAESIKRISTYSTKHSNLSLYLLILGRRRRHIAAALGRNIQNIMNWIILIIAGLCEVGFTYCLGRAKSVEGLEWWLWISGFLVFSVISMTLLAKATQTLPIGVAYPVWTGIGAVGTVLVGIFIFNEPVTFWRLLFTVTLISSIVGLKVLS